MTKGALYHHFGGKIELGHEMDDEVLRVWILGRWLYSIEKASNPIDALIELARRSEQSTDVLSACRLGVERYLETLRPGLPTSRA